MLTRWIQRCVATPFAASVVSVGVILLCSTTIAVVSYRLIESPFLRSDLHIRLLRSKKMRSMLLKICRIGAKETKVLISAEERQMMGTR